VKIHRIHFGKK